MYQDQSAVSIFILKQITQKKKENRIQMGYFYIFHDLFRWQTFLKKKTQQQQKIDTLCYIPS